LTTFGSPPSMSSAAGIGIRTVLPTTGSGWFGHPGIGVADLDDPLRPRPKRLRSEPSGADGHQPTFGGMIDDAAIDP
jgi:hypothetical protein